ncbi:MAG: hypothetical protein JW699_02440 [Chitinispirillaceae bacterium]|nr:hypothetical protein [Chitinispirillaceae bacterium]
MKKTALYASLLIAAAAALARAEPTIDELALFGVSIDYSKRTGRHDFGGDRIEEVDKYDLLTAGVLLGKRWKLHRRLRLQASVDVRYGSSTRDTLPPIPLVDENGGIVVASTLLKTSLFHGGCAAELHYPVSVARDGRWFLIAGAGVHAARMRETELLLDDPAIIVDNDPYVEDDHWTLSASVNAGLGFEIIVSPVFGVAFSYSLRLWNPVRYGMTRDLFPDHPVDYSERFLSHEITFAVLARR